MLIQEWDRVRTDWLTIREGAGSILTPVAPSSAVIPQASLGDLDGTGLEVIGAPSLREALVRSGIAES